MQIRTQTRHYITALFLTGLTSTTFAVGSVNQGTSSSAPGDYATVSGGQLNDANAKNSTIGGGLGNQTDAPQSTIGGGQWNWVSGTGNNSTIAGGAVNIVRGREATIAGGRENTADGDGASVGGGFQNQSTGAHATAAGGFGNKAIGQFATAGGGDTNEVNGTASVIAGGQFNETNNEHAVIGGGQQNDADGDYSTVGGGLTNKVTGVYGTIPGGISNSVTGNFSFAAGRRAKAIHHGAFVWADSTDADHSTLNNDTFSVRAANGAVFSSTAATAVFGSASGTGLIGVRGRCTTTDGAGVSGTSNEGTNSKGVHGASTNGYAGYFSGKVHVTGNLTVAGTINPPSDRNVKTDFAEVDSREVLHRLLDVKIESWKYREDKNKVTHIGPMAQDFSKAFEVGADDKHISTVDADGVALAAIQGLYQELTERDKRIEQLEKEMKELKLARQAD